jgi:Family of unknown function (DUF6011)
MFSSVEQIKAFLFAGKATITLESAKTGKHFTYKIRKPWENKEQWFVDLLIGSNNESDFSYLGMITTESGFSLAQFKETKKSTVDNRAPSFRGFQYMLHYINKEEMPQQMLIYHEGRCGRCNRKLTVPESIESGFGLECIQQLKCN